MAKPPAKPAARVLSIGRLQAIAHRHDAAVLDVVGYEGPLIADDEEEEPRGDIWSAFSQENHAKLLTNFTIKHLNTLYQSMMPHIAALHRRGPRPQSTWPDALLCYLVWARSPEKDFDGLAAALGVPSGRLQDNIARVRPVLNRALHSRWLEPRQRPRPLSATVYPHIALLVDCHTTECFRPIGPFEEAKIYWDGKNSIYGLKSEVAVMASPPHFCLFVVPRTVPSRHDYEYHKSHFEVYLPYLLKTPAEHLRLPGDENYRFWAVAGDKAYIGPDADTPDERRITPKKGHLSQAERARNQNVNRIRVPVEQFFGRLLQSWGFVRGVYRWDHSNFDMDFENACLLTNELIQHNDLQQLDHDFYVKYLSRRCSLAEQKLRKRIAALTHYAQNKRARLLHEQHIANIPS